MEELKNLIKSLAIYDDEKKLISISDKIENLLINLIINNKESFLPILNSIVLKQIIKLIDNLKLNNFNSRSGIEKEKVRLYKLCILTRLRNNIIVNYRELLNNSEIYTKYIEEELSIRGRILNLDEGFIFTYIVPSEIFELYLNSYEDRIIEYFKIQLHQESLNYKSELLFFIEQLKDKIESLNIEIIEQTKLVNSKNKSNYDYLYEQNLILINLKKHKCILERLQGELFNSHLFLKEHYLEKQVPITVFGNRDYDRLRNFYDELRVFLDENLKFEDFILTFTIQSNQVGSKIDLTNGTLNDFGHLINELQVYFIDSIKEKKAYNIWWSERFTFNGVDKNHRSISTFRSNTKSITDASRKSSKIQTIRNIVKTLKDIPQ